MWVKAIEFHRIQVSRYSWVTAYLNCWIVGGGSRVVVSTAVRASFPGLGGLKETKMPSDRQGSKFGSCVWRAVSSHSSHHPQEVLLDQFSLYVHKSGLKPDSFYFYLNSKLLLLLAFEQQDCSYIQRSSLK